MKPDAQDPNGATRPLQPGPPQSSEELQAECQRLALLVREQEEKFKLQGEALARIQEERDQLRAIVYPSLWQQFTEEELRSFAENDSTEGCIELHEFLKEIEDIVHGDRRV